MIKVKKELFKEVDYILEDGTMLYAQDWNGCCYYVNGFRYEPIQKPIMFDENDEPYQWETIGFEKF